MVQLNRYNESKDRMRHFYDWVICIQFSKLLARRINPTISNLQSEDFDILN